MGAVVVACSLALLKLNGMMGQLVLLQDSKAPHQAEAQE